MPSIKSKNKTKTKKSLFKKRFDLTNRKVQFFVVIVIFAILGGGYFTFRSFAATTTVYEWTAAQKNLACYDFANCRVYTDQAKGGISVYQIYGSTANSGISKIGTGTPRVYLLPNTRYNLCATAKGNQQLSVTVGFDAGVPLMAGQIYVNDNNSYKDYCVTYSNTSGTKIDFDIQNRDKDWRVLPLYGVLVSRLYITRDMTSAPDGGPAVPAK